MPTQTRTSGRPHPTGTTGTTERRDASACSVNEVHLVGRLSAPPVVKHLPSGAEVVQLRLVVDRPAGTIRAKSLGGESRSPTVDTIDIACWTAESRRRALSCKGIEMIDVSGALRRRFWRGPAGVASRYEVEVGKLRVLKRAA